MKIYQKETVGKYENFAINKASPSGEVFSLPNIHLIKKKAHEENCTKHVVKKAAESSSPLTNKLIELKKNLYNRVYFII